MAHKPYGVNELREMVLALEELQKHLTQFIDTIGFMSHWELPPKENLV